MLEKKGFQRVSLLQKQLDRFRFFPLLFANKKGMPFTVIRGKKDRYKSLDL